MNVGQGLDRNELIRKLHMVHKVPIRDLSEMFGVSFQRIAQISPGRPDRKGERIERVVEHHIQELKELDPEYAVTIPEAADLMGKIRSVVSGIIARGCFTTEMLRGIIFLDRREVLSYNIFRAAIRGDIRISEAKQMLDEVWNESE